MKIKFENKKWFNFLRYKFPTSVCVGNYCLSNINNSKDSLEIIVGSNLQELEQFIKNVPTELKSCRDEHNRNWNSFIYESDDFKKEIKFCHSSSFGRKDYHLESKLYKPGRFLDDCIFDTDPPNDYKEKEENKMASSNSGIWGMTKEDFKDGLWRNGANEMVKVVKVAILKACKLQSMNKMMYNAVQKTLDWSITTGAIHSALGYALTYVPMLSMHPQAQRMAKELRTEGMKYVQAEIIEQVKELVPDLLKILSSVSPEEESEQRIKVEEKVETKRISAPELTEHQSSIEAMAEKEATVQVKRTTTASI